MRIIPWRDNQQHLPIVRQQAHLKIVRGDNDVDDGQVRSYHHQHRVFYRGSDGDSVWFNRAVGRWNGSSGRKVYIFLVSVTAVQLLSFFKVVRYSPRNPAHPRS
jgi:hypothetical protein